MSRRKIIIIALAALLLVLAVALGFTLTRQPEGPAEQEAVEERREATQDACASRETFDGLKRLVFAQASGGRAADPVNFDVLAASAFVRMEDPVVRSADPTLGLTACEGRIILELPPGAERAFGGERRLIADVRYEAQAAADGSGTVYRMQGAEAIVARLAAFNLQGQRLQMPPEAASAIPPAEPDGALFPAPFPEPDGAPPFQEPPPPPEARPPGAPPQVRPPVSNPSFDCRAARSRSERMVCASDRLAARDRAMSSIFYAALDDADPRTRRELNRTRDAFLAYRDRCGSERCIAQAYEDRIDEIQDIMTARGY